MVIYLDSAFSADIAEVGSMVSGFTTNPSLLRKAGVENYEAWAMETCKLIGDKPISLEVIADDFDAMISQAHIMDMWGANVYVKIPITNTMGESSFKVIRRLAKVGIKVNVTAITTKEQVKEAVKALNKTTKAIISVFAGRIADTGVDPKSTMKYAVRLAKRKGIEVLWASPRQVLDVVTADKLGVHIITVGREILSKLPIIGRDLNQYSRETVQQFYDDATKSGYTV